MSENLIKLYDHDASTLYGARLQAWKLFMQIEQHHGAEQARRIFNEWSQPTSKKRSNELKNWALLVRFDTMDEPNIAQLARDVVAENAVLAKGQQITPRFRPSLPTVDKHLRLLLARRVQALKAGTWEGPTSMKRFNRQWDELVEAEVKSGSS